MQYALQRLACAAALVLSACATHQDIQPSQHALDPKPLGLAEPQSLTAAPPVTPQDEVPDFDDPQLRALISQALAHQPSLQSVRARLARARSQVVSARSAEQPQIQAVAEVDRQRFTEHGLIPPPLGGTVQDTGTLQLEGSWEFDLFGRQRAVVEAAVGQARAAEADAQAARVLLSSQVARAYVQLGRQLAHKAVLERTLAQRQDMLKLIDQRVRAGLDTTVELRQGEGALPEVRQQIEAADEQVALSRHALAALTGQGPQATASLVPSLDRLHTLPLPDHLPVDLLARRADIMAARWRAEASSQAVRAARATFYPNIDLRAYAGYNAIGLEQLLKPGSWQYGLLPAIHLPLFDGDRRRAGLQGAVADEDAAVASYNQAVLDAVREVADQLSTLDSLGRQRAEQQQAQAHAESAYDLAQQRYKAGLGTYLTVLTAESSVLAQRRLAVDLQARVLDAQAALLRALGGSATESPRLTSLPAGDRS